MDRERSLHRGFRRPRDTVPPSSQPHDKRAWRRGSWVFAALKWGSVLLAMPAGQPRVKVPFSPYFVDQLNAGQIGSVSSTGDTIHGTFETKRRHPSGDAGCSCCSPGGRDAADRSTP